MANKTNNFKAQFCRLYFTQLYGFIRKFDVKRNNLGMKFLTEIDDKEYNWDNSVYMSDKNLMAAIEEYFYITDSNSALQDMRETLLKGLILPDKYATDPAVKNVFVEEVTLRTILTYFGIKEEQKIDDQIKAFNSFAESIACGGNLSFARYNQALYLFKLNRNNQAHHIRKQEVYQRKIAFQFLIFTYIGLIYLLRTAWYEKECELLKRYNKPEKFSIPEQSLHIIVNRKDSSNDNIIGYEFVPNIKKGNERIKKSIDPKAQLDIIVPVRKYDKFKLIIKYGTSDNKIVDLPFGEKGDTMLSYYYWEPTWIINLPSSSSIHPGLSLEVHITEELVTRLLENVNKQQEGAAKQKVTAIVNEVLCALEPTLQQIRDLSGNPQNSADDNEKLNNLIKKVNGALQKQIDKNEETFRKLMNKMDELKENQTKEFHKLSAKAEDYFKVLKEEVHNLSEQIKKEKEDTLQSDKNKFWGRQWPNYVLDIAAFGLFVYSLVFCDLSLTWLQNTWLWIILPFVLLLLSSLWTWYVYKTTVSNKASLIRPRTKWISGSSLAAFCIFIALSIIVIPNKTIPSLAANYDFFSFHNEGDNAKAAQLMEHYLYNNKPTDDENIRIKLTQYYLSYANIKEKALEVSRPMRDDINKYKKGSIFAAEALYETGENYWRVDEIIKKYRKKYSDIPGAINRIQGIMYCYGHFYDKDVQKGVELLKEASDIQGDKIAQYYLGHIFSHVMSEWSTSTESTDTLFNLIRAIEYYRKVADVMPKASIELGTLYADLNMTDSAKFYFKKALSNSDQHLKSEANYRLGVLLYSLGDKDNEYLADAKDVNYAPALLFAAINEKQHQGAIDCYEAMGRYKGYRCIPPVVFEYIIKGDKTKALDTLNATKPGAHFNEEFVDAMYAMLTTKDSIKGAELMHISAEKGCKYAKMICSFRQMENELNNSNYKLSQITYLEELGRDSAFAFANVLAAHLYAIKAAHLDSIEGEKIAAPIYRKSAELAVKAINQKHPAGSIIFLKSNLFSYYFDHITQQSQSLLSIKHELSVMFLMLRLLPNEEKSYFINHAFTNDLIINHNIERENRNGEQYVRFIPITSHRHFWSDVAIANNYLMLINQFLLDTNNSDEEYTKKLYSAGLKNVTNNSDDVIKNILSSRALSMSKDGMRYYIDSLKTLYKGNSLKTDILNGKYKKYNNGDKIHLHFEWTIKKYFIDNQVILDEFSGLDNHIYFKPL